MTLIQIIEGVATCLWTYAALSGAVWAIHLWRLERSAHVAAVVDLLGHLVPAMIALVVIVLTGAFVGLPSVVALIALLFPGGLAFGTHMALSEAREATEFDHPENAPLLSRALPRLIATLLIAGVVIIYRQVL